LQDALTWEERFSILDAEILWRVERSRQLPTEIVWAWHRLVQSDGRIRIAELVRELGWSERHFARQFNEHIGLSPKVFARVLRFAGAVRVLTTDRSIDLADVALACGYFDQSHFTREFRAFAGTTPVALRGSRLPKQAGFRTDG
jgi:AraC-like DNA-binding protein